MDHTDLLGHQDGVISRVQLLAAGWTDGDLRRAVRRKELTRVQAGVFANHTGPLSAQQRGWAAVLRHAPAALWGESALALGPGPVHVGVHAERRLAAAPGVVVHRISHLDEQTRWQAAPPRQLLEHAVLTACAAANSADSVFAILADVCQQRRTTPERLRSALDRHGPVRHGQLIGRLLDDAGAGALSVLERSYLARVERAHALPRGQRQERRSDGRVLAYHDVLYEGFGVIVELDGRIGHELFHDRSRDQRRDLDALTAGLVTVRLGWSSAHEQSCATAQRLSRLLQSRGWTGIPKSCGVRHCLVPKLPGQ